MDFFIFLQYPGAFFSKINSYLYTIKTFRQHFIINLQMISGLLLSGQHRHQGPVSKKNGSSGISRQAESDRKPPQGDWGRTSESRSAMSLMRLLANTK